MEMTIALRLVMSIVLALIGIYLFICAVRVKGSVYMNPALQRTKHYDKYITYVRVVCFVLPTLFLINLVLCTYSYLAQHRLQNSSGADAGVAAELLETAKGAYTAASISLITVIAAVVIVILIAAFITGSMSSSVVSEKLDKNAFRKD